MKTGAPGKAAWIAQTPESASAMPTVSEPAMVIGVVEPPCGMVTKPIGTPASAKTRPAPSVPSSWPRGVMVPSNAEIGGARRTPLIAAGDGARHLDGHARLGLVDDGHRLHVLAGIGQHVVDLMEAASGDRAILGADGRPAEVDLVEGVDDARDGDRVGRRGRPLGARLEVVDVGGATVGGEQRALAGDQGAVGPGAEGQARRGQGDEVTHDVGGNAHSVAVGAGAGCDERRAGRRETARGRRCSRARAARLRRAVRGRRESGSRGVPSPGGPAVALAHLP